MLWAAVGVRVTAWNYAGVNNKARCVGPAMLWAAVGVRVTAWNYAGV